MHHARTLSVPLLLLLGCGNPTFEAPDAPVHDVSEDGALHGRRYESPFLCGQSGVDGENGIECPPSRPPDALLPCDASGCHGDYDFSADAPRPRALYGSDGPSCYTCHGEEWND